MRQLPNGHELIWQQDGHPAHTAKKTVEFIQRKWDPQRVISLSSRQSRGQGRVDFGEVMPAYSPDLATPDWWLFPWLKRKLLMSQVFLRQ